MAVAQTLQGLAVSAERLSGRLRCLSEKSRPLVATAIVANMAVAGVFPLVGADDAATQLWLGSFMSQITMDTAAAAAEAAEAARRAAALRAPQGGGGGSGAGRYSERGQKRAADDGGERERRERRESASAGNGGGGGGGGDGRLSASDKRPKQSKDEIETYKTAWCFRKDQIGKKLESGVCPVCGPPGESGEKKWGHAGGLDRCKLVPKSRGGGGDSWSGAKTRVFKDGAEFPIVGSIMSEPERANAQGLSARGLSPTARGTSPELSHAQGLSARGLSPTAKGTSPELSQCARAERTGLVPNSKGYFPRAEPMRKGSARGLSPTARGTSPELSRCARAA